MQVERHALWTDSSVPIEADLDETTRAGLAAVLARLSKAGVRFEQGVNGNPAERIVGVFHEIGAQQLIQRILGASPLFDLVVTVPDGHARAPLSTLGGLQGLDILFGTGPSVAGCEAASARSLWSLVRKGWTFDLPDPRAPWEAWSHLRECRELRAIPPGKPSDSDPSAWVVLGDLVELRALDFLVQSS